MKAFKSFLKNVLLALTLISCFYSPKDRFVSPIKPPQPIKVSIDIQDPKVFTDPFPLNFITNFIFKIDSTDKPILSCQVFFDDAILNDYSLIDRSVQFTLSPCTMANGNHKVKIKANIYTQSGSLADQLGSEYYTVEKDFTVVVDRDLPKGGQPVSFAMENGYLVLSWPAQSKTNFYYAISYYSYSLGLGGDTVITDPTITRFVDKGYVGGQVTYGVKIFNCSMDPTYIGGGNVDFTPIFAFSVDKNFRESIAWDTTALKSNHTTINFQGPLWTRSVPFNLGSFFSTYLPLGFNDVSAITIKRDGFPNYKSVTNVYFTAPQNIPNYHFIKALNTNELLIAQGVDIKRINWNTLAKEDSLSAHISNYYYPYTSIGQFATSADGNSAIVMDGYFGTLYLFNPHDLSKMTQKDFVPFDIDYSYANIATGKIGSLSNNQLMGVNYVYNSGSGWVRIAGVLDLSTVKTVWSDTLNSDSPILSADGNYFAVNDISGSSASVYKNAGGSWQLAGKVPSGLKFFRNNLSSELIITGSGVSVYDLSSTPDTNGDFQLVRSLPIVVGQTETLKSISYDEIAQQISVETVSNNYPITSTIKAYDIQTFSYIGSGTAVNSDHFYSNGYHAISGYISQIIK